MGEDTRLLDEARSGDATAGARFCSRIHADLDRLLRQGLASSAPLTVLDASSLLHEVYLGITPESQLYGSDRRTFLGHASRVMHRVVMDYVRSRSAERNGSAQRLLSLNTGVAHQAFAPAQLEALGSALDALARIDERAHRIVEMRYFGGMEVDEIAEVLDISAAAVKRDWEKARAFLLNSQRFPVDPC